MTQEEHIVLGGHCCKKMGKTRDNLVCTGKGGPADEDRGDHIPIFFGHLVEKIKTMAQGGTGEVLKAVPMNLKGSAGGSQLVKIGRHLPALPTGFREEDGDRDRSSRDIVRDSSGLRGAARKKEGEAEHCSKYNTGPSHGQPSHETVLFAYRMPSNKSTDGNNTVHCIPLNGKEKPCRS